MNRAVKDSKEVALFYSFLLTSARGLIHEPLLYGPSRCLSAVMLLHQLLEEEFDYQDTEVTTYVDDVDDIRLLCMTDVDAFVKAIDQKVTEGGKLIEKKENDYHRKVLGFYLFLLENARKLVEEPKMYGPWRLLSAMSTLNRMLNEQFEFNDPGLSSLILEVEEINRYCLTDAEEFIQKLDACILQMVRLAGQS